MCDVAASRRRELIKGVMGLKVGFWRGGVGGVGGRSEEGEERIRRVVVGGRGWERRARRCGRVGGVKVVRFLRRVEGVGGCGGGGCDSCDSCGGGSEFEVDVAREVERTASRRGPGRGWLASGGVSLSSKGGRRLGGKLVRVVSRRSFPNGHQEMPSSSLHLKIKKQTRANSPTHTTPSPLFNAATANCNLSNHKP